MKKTLLTMFENGTLQLLVLAVALAVSLAFSGCIYRGAKVTEGTDLAVGFTVPGTEGAMQFDALNYLTGFRLGVAENAALTVRYTCAETNSYLGVVTTRVYKSIDAKVEPTVAEATVDEPRETTEAK